MSRAFCLLVIASRILLSVPVSEGAPEPSKWHREQLLGANSEYFFYLLTERDNPASHFDYTVRFEICKARKDNPTAVVKLMLRETRYQDSSANGQWKSFEQSTRPFDLTSYLIENHVMMAFGAFPGNSRSTSSSLVIDTAGVFFRDGSTRARILSRSELLIQIPETEEQPHVAALELVAREEDNGPAYNYYTVQSHVVSIGENWFEDLLVIPADRVKAAADIVGRARGPR